MVNQVNLETIWAWVSMAGCQEHRRTYRSCCALLSCDATSLIAEQLELTLPRFSSDWGIQLDSHCGWMPEKRISQKLSPSVRPLEYWHLMRPLRHCLAHIGEPAFSRLAVGAQTKHPENIRKPCGSIEANNY